MKKISCIIPAYNEAKGIGRTLSVVLPLLSTRLHEVIVIDDCSTDDTKAIVRTFTEVRLVEHIVNTGKSKTVADGISISTGDYIFLLDADLQFLNTQNIIDILDPIEKEISQVTISYRKNAWPLFPFKQIDYLSGERVLSKASLISTLSKMEQLPGYGLEVFLNRIIINQQMSIFIVQWPNVENVFNQHKYGWLYGVRVIIKIWWNVLSTVSIIEMYTQNFAMRKLLVSKSSS